MVPHEHINRDNDLTIIHNHECTTNLFGEIQLSFGTDHGDGHLEQFVKVIHTMPKPFLTAILVFDYPVTISDVDYIFVENDYRPVTIPPDPQRGPPSDLV
jgi:hypothetical protein